MGQAVCEEDVQILVPLFGIGGGQAIDEVDADVAETNLFGPVEALAGVMCVMAATQILQVVVEEALDADAQSVDSKSAQAFKVFQ